MAGGGLSSVDRNFLHKLRQQTATRRHRKRGHVCVCMGTKTFQQREDDDERSEISRSNHTKFNIKLQIANSKVCLLFKSNTFDKNFYTNICSKLRKFGCCCLLDVIGLVV